MLDYLPFLIFLMILAVFLQAGPALTVFYMIVGIFLLGLWWNKRALRHVKIERHYEDHAYLNEIVHVRLTIENESILPILWLEIHESLPVNLRAGQNVKQVFSLGIRASHQIDYDLRAFKRGYFELGPTSISTGDPLGMVKPAQQNFPSTLLTIYPQIVGLSELGLPSRSPFGTIQRQNPIFEDPTRLMGKRAFQSGDSVRRVDWKATAAIGDLMVKLYEASIALNLTVLLDLQRESYNIQSIHDSTELAVTAAASLAAWAKRRQHTMGLLTNGLDPHTGLTVEKPIPPGKGAGHFINVLELLARIQIGETRSTLQLIQDARARLSWGTTLIYISGGVSTGAFKQLFQARKAGLNPVILLVGHPTHLAEDRRVASGYHLPLYAAGSVQALRTMAAKVL
ncbi:MAG: DUF58 domain-containing protein [Chloroflexota bacterium]|nr:DUF58 domain-containing protein [Chloroflexota bacterium]